MNAKVTTGIFLALIFGLAAVNLATPDRAFSENENRYLRQTPEFSPERLFEGKYTSEFDSYIVDQFVFRDNWVGLKAASEQALQKHASNGIYFARDGYLIEMFTGIDRDRYARNLGFVAALAGNAKALGADFHMTLIPSASTILADKLPAFAPEINQRECLDQAAMAVPGFINTVDGLLQHRDEYIYCRTDHHWTSLGAFYAYRSLFEQLGTTPQAMDSFDRETLSTDFYGTAWSKASLYSAAPDTIEAWKARDTQVHVDYNNGGSQADSIYEPSYLDSKDKYSVFLNANQSVTKIATGSPGGKKLLLVKDSYANAFVQFLLRDYGEIIVVDPRYYHDSFSALMERESVTDVLVLYSLKGFAADPDVYYTAL